MVHAGSFFPRRPVGSASACSSIRWLLDNSSVILSLVCARLGGILCHRLPAMVRAVAVVMAQVEGQTSAQYQRKRINMKRRAVRGLLNSRGRASSKVGV